VRDATAITTGSTHSGLRNRLRMAVFYAPEVIELACADRV
jgi:hypothetical protein